MKKPKTNLKRHRKSTLSRERNRMPQLRHTRKVVLLQMRHRKKTKMRLTLEINKRVKKSMVIKKKRRGRHRLVQVMKVVKKMVRRGRLREDSVHRM